MNAMQSKYSNPEFGSLVKSLLTLAVLLCLAPALRVMAQGEDLITPRINLSVTQLSGDSIELQALLRAKFETVYEKVGYADILFYAIGEEDEKLIGKDETNQEGVAEVRFAAREASMNAEGFMTFLARFEGDSELDENEADASVRKASMTITPLDQDSILAIRLHVAETSPEGDSALADADVALFVKRMVGNLKVGEGTTDEEGTVEIDFPTDLAGDDVGNILITAYIEDFGDYGNIRATTVQPWGSPVSFAITEWPRALWTAAPPTWLLIVFLVLLGILWGHYVEIVYKLIRLHKHG
jgi:hypothetical protein